MKYCENCGCKTFNGLCPYCDEETYIYEQNATNEEQIEFSPEFMEKVKEQSKKRVW